MKINLTIGVWCTIAVTFVACGDVTLAEIRIVTPAELDGVEGNSSTVPTGGLAFRGQQLVSAADFASLPPSHRVITELAFRPDVGNTVTAPFSEPRRIILSTTTVDSLNLTFSSNYGTDPIVVFDDTITYQTDDIGTGPGPQPFDFVIPFDTPYTYDPDQGNLLWEIVIDRGSTETGPTLDSHTRPSGPITAVGSLNPNAEVANMSRHHVYPVQFTFAPELLTGDFNMNGELDVEDIDSLSAEVCSGLHREPFDLNDDELVDGTDVGVWVRDLKNTWIGDANLDGEFNSSDMVQVFAGGKYETGQTAGWSEGDWDGSCVFHSSDMVAAFADGGYEKGPRAAVAAVPEPTSVLLLMAGLIGVAILRHCLRM